jgi:hypothetical protein
MPHKPLRQLAAEKARGNKPANPSQLGDPIDLKAETSDEPDPVENEHDPSSSDSKGDNIGTNLKVPRAALEGDPKKEGEEKGVVTGIGTGAGPVGGVRKKESKL